MSLSSVIYAIDVTVYIPGTGIATKYFATEGVTYNSNYYEPRLNQPGNFQQNIFTNGTTGGASQVGFGEIILINNDGGLDSYINYGFDGRAIVLRKIINGVGTILLTGSMEQPTPSWDNFSIRIKDKQQLLNVSIQPNKYAGTNVLPLGIEGVLDIKGQPKPLVFGKVFNISPVCVNTSKLIYQVKDGPISGISAVYDKGVSLTIATPYVSLNDMLSNAPSAGQVRVWAGGGMFRLGSSPAGQVTCDVVEGPTTADRTAAQITKRIINKISMDSTVFSLIARGNCVVSGGNTISKVGGSNAYDSDCYTAAAITGPCIASCIPNQINKAIIFGLNTDPITDQNYTSIDYGILIYNTGYLYIYESGNEIVANVMTYTVGDVMSVEYDGYYIIYRKNGTLVHSSIAGTEKTFYIDTSFYNVGGAISNVTFSAPSISIDSADITALDTANSSELGIYVKNETTIISVLDELLNSVGVWYGFDSVGVFNMSRLEAPSGSPISTLTQNEILTIERQATQDQGRGIPAWRVNMSYEKNYTVQNTDALAGSVMTFYSWQQAFIPIYFQDIAYGNGIYVAVTYASSVSYTSTDGFNWTLGASNNLPGLSNKYIAFGAGCFIVTADDNHVYRSTDGINWTAYSTGSYWVNGSVLFGNSTFVATTDNSTAYVLTSADGITWTPRAFPAANNYKTAAFGNGVFCIIAGNSVYTSSDGISWSTGTVGIAGHPWQRLIYGNGVFVAISIGTNPTVIYSGSATVGSTGWTAKTIPPAVLQTPTEIAYLGGTYLVGTVGTWQSTDLTNWTEIPGLKSAWIKPVNNMWFVQPYYGGSPASLYICTSYTTDSRRQWLSTDYRVIVTDDSTVKTTHLLTPEINYKSLFTAIWDAYTEALRLLALRKINRDYLSVKVPVSILPADVLGKVINITIPRYGYNSGKLFVVLGVTFNYELNEVELRIWG